ncbi:hypothetical protein Tco_1123456 [Tanacetum coccineum]|uniref:Uncharacterized protein n=1 Tax=Tanacetum coccineum TaxID=301880 RepID=A0ABQ5J4H3_9ASTR
MGCNILSPLEELCPQSLRRPGAVLWKHCFVQYVLASDATLHNVHAVDVVTRCIYLDVCEYLLWGHCQWGVLVVPPPAPLTAVAVVATATLVIGLSPGLFLRLRIACGLPLGARFTLASSTGLLAHYFLEVKFISGMPFATLQPINASACSLRTSFARFPTNSGIEHGHHTGDLVNISKRRAFWSLNEDILKIYYSENQYVVSIKEDMAYSCLHSPKTTKETNSIRRI